MPDNELTPERYRELAAVARRRAAAAEPITGKDNHNRLVGIAWADTLERIADGGDFDRECARFEYLAQLSRERHNVFLWDGPTTGRGYRHPSWRLFMKTDQARTDRARSGFRVCLRRMQERRRAAMCSEQRPYIEELHELIGAAAIVQLCGLIFQNDMTPTEARPWLEPPDRNWPEVERLLFEIYERRYPNEEPLPPHLTRWVERYRAAHPRRLTSLFE